jgi:hypothetical protein
MDLMRRYIVEEELGQLRLTGHSEYAICSRCGQPFEARPLRDLPPEAVDAAPQDLDSPYQTLCRDCVRDVAGGEIELPPETE